MGAFCNLGFPQSHRHKSIGQVSIFEACAETKGKVHLPTFLKLLHGDCDPRAARRRLMAEDQPM